MPIEVLNIGKWRWVIASEDGPEEPTTRGLLHVMAMLMTDGRGCTRGTRTLAAMTGLSRDTVAIHRWKAAEQGFLIAPVAPDEIHKRHARGLAWRPSVPDHLASRVAGETRHSQSEISGRTARPLVAGETRHTRALERSADPATSGGQTRPVVAGGFGPYSASLHNSPPAAITEQPTAEQRANLAAWATASSTRERFGTLEQRIANAPLALRWRGYHRYLADIDQQEKLNGGARCA